MFTFSLNSKECELKFFFFVSVIFLLNTKAVYCFFPQRTQTNLGTITVLYFSLRSPDPHWELASQQTRLRVAQMGCGLGGERTRAGAPGSGLEASLPWGTQGPGNLWRVGSCEIEAQEKGYKVGRLNTFLWAYLLLPETCWDHREGKCLFQMGSEISKRPFGV